MQVVDPHIHLWDLKTHHYPWLANPGKSFVGDARELKHDYLINDFLSETGPVQVLKIVHVDANHDPDDPVEETRWLQEIADNEGRGMPDAIVAGADLSAKNADEILAAHAAFRNTRGIRQILNVHSNPLYNYVRRHFMRDAQWRKNFGLLKHYSMSFDLQLYPSQMHEAASLAQEHHEIQFIVNHAGMCVDRDPAEGKAQWRDGMRALAACPNVAVKISGLAMFDHAWTVESFRPYVLETIDVFGCDRSMFASNFPVDRLFASYEALWNAYAFLVKDFSDTEKEALFTSNAERIYRI
ncbi:amidohydrolase family protein [Caballeronia sp. DA-9]|uniref:amidohydrolase family protein n=1 Tax=Caballeronia sp. DA-9 TaxID=3436237 RepID=UPI003F67C13D